MEQNELMHYGVLGMRWGHRKSSSKSRTNKKSKVPKGKEKQIKNNISKGKKKADEFKTQKVKEILKNTNTPTEFIKNSNKIGKELNEEFEFYFVDNYICAETLDNFIKEEYLEEKETEFEIVKTWDYHF